MTRRVDAVTDHRCGTCRHYAPTRGPSGRVRPSEPGSCHWRHACANDPVPFSGVKHWGAGPHTIGDATELRHRVRNIDGSICQCWMAR